jgi:SAM-dependent methyltransferase
VTVAAEELMTQIDTGPRALLGHPSVYRAYPTFIGTARARWEFVRTYLRLGPGDAVLDIGCGPGDLLFHVPAGCRYRGYDMSADYIRAARRRFGRRGDFLCARVGADGFEERGGFDRVMAFGLLHHLDDREAAELFRVGRQALRPGGRMVTVDPAWVPGQAGIARFLIAHDRGRNVRTPEGYCSLARQVFAEARAAVRDDLLRIPYTLVIVEAFDPDAAAPDPPSASS